MKLLPALTASFLLALRPLAASDAPAMPEAMPATHPNILFILADDLGYEMLGCYGGKTMQTPNLDRMAKEGVRFTRAYASAVCTPSRMSIYTGQYAATHGYRKVIPVHEGTREAVDFTNTFTCYAKILRDAGYATSVTGKWQLGALEHHPLHAESAGFDSWCIWQIWHNGAKTLRYWDGTYNVNGTAKRLGGDTFGPDAMRDYVVAQMKQAAAGGKPFMVHHNMVLPHTPLVQTPDDRAAGRKASLPNMIAYLDKEVGFYLDVIRELGLADNTIVIFAGDNGTEAKRPRKTVNGTVRGGKWTLNDAGTHVPLIVWGPREIPAGRVISDLIDITDLYATLCDFAGAKIPEGVATQSRSFAPQAKGQTGNPRGYVTASFESDWCVFDGEWRLHRNGNRLIDCRALPEEKLADMTTAEAQAAYRRLAPILARSAEK